MVPCSVSKSRREEFTLCVTLNHPGRTVSKPSSSRAFLLPLLSLASLLLCPLLYDQSPSRILLSRNWDRGLQRGTTVCLSVLGSLAFCPPPTPGWMDCTSGPQLLHEHVCGDCLCGPVLPCQDDSSHPEDPKFEAPCRIPYNVSYFALSFG